MNDSLGMKTKKRKSEYYQVAVQHPSIYVSDKVYWHAECLSSISKSYMYTVLKTNYLSPSQNVGNI